MDYAFSESIHDRSAQLRADDRWREPGGNVRALVLGGEHVASDGAGHLKWLTIDQAPDGLWLFLGDVEGQRYAAVVVSRVAEELNPVSLRAVGPNLTAVEASLAVHAVGLARWHQSHTFCSRCGTQTQPAAAGHERRCGYCEATHFPRTDPAVIMLITDDQDRALLGRQPSWPPGRFSTLAGFVEPGESLEDAVRREISEEVGIVVGQVQYAGSQPWPFPSSLMVGFFGHADSVQITVDGAEIAEAHWFSRDQLTAMTAESTVLLPPKLSVSRALIEHWHGGTISGYWP